MKQAVLTLCVGAAMGFILSRIGFSSWDEVHGMFTFAEPRMFLAFAIGVALLAGATLLLRRLGSRRVRSVMRPIHRGTVLGGVLFGAGWALSGACPSIALVQLGEGQLAAGFTLAGIFAGNWLYALARERYLHWDTGSCVDE
jgi:uncharacterized membrane protein YedE/YeeE